MPGPTRCFALFPEAVYENAFGTVVGPPRRRACTRSRPSAPTTTTPTTGGRIASSSATRSRSTSPGATSRSTRSPGARPLARSPHSSIRTAAAVTSPRGLLRAVGDPKERFEEDALRMVRAVRLAATLGFTIEPATLAGIAANADLVRYLSGERISTELSKLLAAERPSIGLRLLADTGLLERDRPGAGAAARRAPEQGSGRGPLGSHGPHRRRRAASTGRSSGSRRCSTTSASRRRTADGHFLGHDVVGAELAGELLDALRSPRAVRERVVHLVRHHMFSYEPPGPTPRCAGSSARSGSDARRRPVRAARGGQRRAAACRPAPESWTSCANASARELAAEVVLDRSRLADRRARPDRGARPAPGPAARPDPGASSSSG